MLMLALTRELPTVFTQQREARWDSAAFRELPTLAGRTLGILGVGAIGKRVAQLGAAFGMRVIGLRRGAAPVPFVDKMLGPEQLPELLSQAHYVVNVLPSTAQTHGLIGAAQLATMRRDAVIINVGRGKTIDTDALVNALREGRIAGAGLDVTEPEPLPAEHPLWKLPNVIITPHYSGGRAGYVDAVLDVFVDNVSRYREQRALRNVVDLHAGY
jgi:phosphoglycerate dehydrogenase-like enzyme